MEHIKLVLRRKCNTWSTFIEVSRSPATVEYFGRQLVLPGKCKHLEHINLFLRGRRSTSSTSSSFCLASEHLEHLHRGQQMRRQFSTLGPGWFCATGAALGAHQACFASQVQHLEHLHTGQEKSGHNSILWAPARFAWQAHIKLVLRGKHST